MKSNVRMFYGRLQSFETGYLPILQSSAGVSKRFDLTLFCPLDYAILICTIWISPFSFSGVSGVVFHFYFISNRNSFNTNSTDPAASDLVLHCLLMSFFGDARHIWVNIHVQELAVQESSTRHLQGGILSC